MLIQLNNLPSDVTQENIDTLCQHSHLINSIHVVKNDHSEKVYAWIELDCSSRVGLNAICNVLNTKYLNGNHIMAYPSLHSH